MRHNYISKNHANIRLSRNYLFIPKSSVYQCQLVADWFTGDSRDRSSHLEVFLRKGVLKICSKFTEEHRCQSAISIKLLCNFIEIALWHECSLVNLLHIFRQPFTKNTSGRLLLVLQNRHVTNNGVLLVTTSFF